MTTPETTTERPPIINSDGQNVRPFDEWLCEFRNGLVVHELSLDLHALIGEVMATEKAGSMTVKINVSPVGETQIQVTAESSTKPPKPAPAASLYYVDQHGNPSRHDPQQARLPL